MRSLDDEIFGGLVANEHTWPQLAKALKVAYDALDSVPQIDEALEASQKYPIEKPEAKDSQFVSAGDKQPTTAIDAKDIYTKGHSTRVADYAVILAKRLGWGEDRIIRVRE